MVIVAPEPFSWGDQVHSQTSGRFALTSIIEGGPTTTLLIYSNTKFLNLRRACESFQSDLFPVKNTSVPTTSSEYHTRRPLLLVNQFNPFVD